MPVIENKTFSTSYVNNNGEGFGNINYSDKVRNINFNKLFTFPSSKTTLYNKLQKLLKTRKHKKKKHKKRKSVHNKKKYTRKIKKSKNNKKKRVKYKKQT